MWRLPPQLPGPTTVDDSLDEILIDTGKCTKEEILKASDHVLFLLNKLNNSREAFISGINFENYIRERNVSTPTKIHGMEDFANVLYDQFGLWLLQSTTQWWILIAM